MKALSLGICFCVLMLFQSCEQAGYSFRGGQFSGAGTFSVDYFVPRAAQATQAYAQELTESFKDLMLSQSPLDLTQEEGDLQFEGFISGYQVSYAGVQSDEKATSNRLTVTVQVKYTNTLDPSLSFDQRSFSASSDFSTERDIFSIQEILWADINQQLSQNIYNATVGNW